MENKAKKAEYLQSEGLGNDAFPSGKETLAADKDDMIRSLTEKNQKLESRNAHLENLVRAYEEELRLARQKRFGKSSEKTAGMDQQMYIADLFDEAENTADKTEPEPVAQAQGQEQAEETEVKAYRRRKQGQREIDLSKLESEEKTYDFDAAPECPECGRAMCRCGSTFIGSRIKYVPARYIRVDSYQAGYACKSCGQETGSTPMEKAPVPEQAIKGSVATSSLIAGICVAKYVNATPLYRQEADFKRNGIPISRQNMANWIIAVALGLLAAVYREMIKALKLETYIHADETTLEVLKEPGRKANTNSYMWEYCSGEAANRYIFVYVYTQTRSAKHPMEFLDGWGGYIMCDGYDSYHLLETARKGDITAVGCWLHARRGFTDAYKALPKETIDDAKPNEYRDSIVDGIRRINELFNLERYWRELGIGYDERYRLRLQKSKQYAEELFKWASEVHCLPKTGLGKAVQYLLNQKQWLMNVYLDGHLEFSNNRAERGVKPLVTGRRNWLFCNTPRGAESSVILYSIIETAKANGLNPFSYLEYLLDTLPNIKASEVASLLPWSDDLPTSLYAKGKPVVVADVMALTDVAI
jgi:transposase